MRPVRNGELMAYRSGWISQSRIFITFLLVTEEQGKVNSFQENVSCSSVDSVAITAVNDTIESDQDAPLQTRTSLPTVWPDSRSRCASATDSNG